MDDELLHWLYHRLLHDPKLAHTRSCTFSDGLIVLIYFFAVKSNGSSPRACQPKYWPLWCRRLKLPSLSQFNRRLKSRSVEAIILGLNDELRLRLPHRDDKAADGKPLAVSGFSHDPDAKTGHVPGGFAKGYKLHVIADDAGGVDAWQVTPLNRNEARVLCELLSRTDWRGVTLRADASYDCNVAYAAAAAAGARLVAPRRKPHRSLGHHPQHIDRLRAIIELESDHAMLRRHRLRRNRVEQTLAHLTNLPCGLWGLPNFVRRLRRVKLWVAAKITLYHLCKTLALTQHAAA